MIGELKMQCVKCGAELDSGVRNCPNCGTLAALEIEGFENAVVIQQKMKEIIDDHGEEVIDDIHRFISLVKDYLPEYDRERRLIINALLAGSAKFMLAESDPNIAVMRTRSCILSECYVTFEASEFIIACFCFMLGWEYELEEPEEEVAVEKEESNKPEESPTKNLKIDSKVFRPVDAARYRLAGTVSIAEGFTKIDNFTFNSFGRMKTITLPSTMMAIGDYAFSECKRLKGIDLPPSLRNIQRGAFNQCVKLAVIKIPAGVLEIDDDTFSFCENLEVVELPDTVSSIGAQAFCGCTKLRKLFLPESVKYIEPNAFWECPELTIRCFEHSYVHKFCIKNKINVETVSKGAELTARITEEG